MIEYALLYGLGFLSAALIVLLIAPAVHHRIVRYTETRLKATMPLSTQEIRAQKDMVRAVYAAENARTTHELARTREKVVALQMQNETQIRDGGKLLGEFQDQQAVIRDMEVEAGRLRAEILDHRNRAISLEEVIKRLEETAAAKDDELDKLLSRLKKIERDFDSQRIEGSTREMEIDTLKQRLLALRDEREDLRRENRKLDQRAREAEQRLGQEEHTRIRLDDRLARQLSENADKDALIERRTQELARLREKLKATTTAAEAATHALRAENLAVPAVAERVLEEQAGSSDAETSAEAAEAPLPVTVETQGETPALVAEGRDRPELDRMGDELRNRKTALVERLSRPSSGAQDDALREEIADIAARMIVLTSLSEGRGSPVDELLSTRTTRSEPGKRQTLAERARKLKPLQDEADDEDCGLALGNAP